MPRRPVQAEQEALAPAGRRCVDPEGGVLAVGDEPQPRIDDGIAADRHGGQASQARDLLTLGEHSTVVRPYSGC